MLCAVCAPVCYNAHVEVSGLQMSVLSSNTWIPGIKLASQVCWQSFWALDQPLSSFLSSLWYWTLVPVGKCSTTELHPNTYYNHNHHYFKFWDRVLLSYPDWPSFHPPASTSYVARPQVCTTTPSFLFFLENEAKLPFMGRHQNNVGEGGRGEKRHPCRLSCLTHNSITSFSAWNTNYWSGIFKTQQ